MLAVGSVAPDFTLPNQHRQNVTLSSFRGRRHVVVAFHPLAFTPICNAQGQSYERERAAFDALDAHVLVISSDAGPSKKAWADSIGLSYDALSDFHPQGAVAARYGVLRDDGLAERSVFLVDKDGVVRWAKVYGMEGHPDVNDVLDALRARPPRPARNAT
ncbi:MAG: redoxin domain-containing protein [Acidobacteria bacterium]|nr:redoxin domain-containing protein [Acidobacteriota bacterium]